MFYQSAFLQNYVPQQQVHDHQKYLYKPIELRLDTDPNGEGLYRVIQEQTVQRAEFDKRRDHELIREIKLEDPRLQTLKTELQNMNQNNNNLQQTMVIQQNTQEEMNKYHDGLISVLKGESNGADKIKTMICVTMYGESRIEMQKTIDGIMLSADKFMKHGTAPHQIGITVIFDGIENIHNTIDDNGSSFQENIIPYFKEQFDNKFGIDKLKSLEYQYKEYQEHKKRSLDYTPANIAKLKRNKQQLIEKFTKCRLQLRETMRELNNGPWIRTDEFVESKIVAAMCEQYKQSKKYIENRQNTAWVYQTRRIILVNTTDNNGRPIKKEALVPIFYVFKFRNGSKLSSHMWFFKGFCKLLKPDYCVLLDCGAVPKDDAVYTLIAQMEAQEQLGGVCGSMHIEEDHIEEQVDSSVDFFSQLINTSIFSIKKCQSCEYDIGHVLDKQYESALNYIHVLPGAFSAYRFKAFTQKFREPTLNNNRQENQDPEQPPQQNNNPQHNQDLEQRGLIAKQNNISTQNDILEAYLKQTTDPEYTHKNIQEANMFLAEDRVLCQLIFCNGYYLRYIPDAHVYVDACKSLPALLLQRRRWINGSWFALNYVLDTFDKKLETSQHTSWDKFKFRFSLASAQIGQATQYFYPTFQIVWLYMILNTFITTRSSIADQIIVSAIITLYIFVILMLVFLGLTYDPTILKQQKDHAQITAFYNRKYYAVSTILGLINLGTVTYTMYLIIYEIIIKTSLFDFVDRSDLPQSYYCLLIIINIAMNMIPFIVKLIISDDRQTVLNIFFNSIHYIYFQPTYTHLFLIYSFCRIDDLSWGTKGLTEDSDKRSIGQDKKLEKYYFITKWLTLNAVISAILMLLTQMNVYLFSQSLILVVSVMITLLSITKGFFSLIYFQLYGGHKDTRLSKETQTEKQQSATIKKAYEFKDKLDDIFK